MMDFALNGDGLYIRSDESIHCVLKAMNSVVIGRCGGSAGRMPMSTADHSRDLSIAGMYIHVQRKQHVSITYLKMTAIAV